MWQVAPSATGAAVTPDYGLQYYEPYPPPTAYGTAPYVAYAQGTTGAENANASSDNYALTATVVVAMSFMCIVFSIFFILMGLRNCSADGGTSSGPADQNGHDGRHDTLRPLLVQQETIRVEPSIPLTKGTTTAQMTTRAETTTAEKTTTAQQKTVAEKTTTTTPRTTTTEKTITTPQTTTTLPWTTAVKTTTMPETTIAENTTATSPSTTENTTTTPETTATEEVTVILQTDSTESTTTTPQTTTIEYATPTPQTTKEEVASTPQTTTVEETTNATQVSSEGTTEGGTPTAIEPTELTSPQAEVMRRQPLLCTMGTKADTAQMFPEDGLCDYLFHDSVYKSGISTFDPPDEVDTDLNTFVEQREEYVITEFGIGFGFKNAAYLATLISKSQTPNSPFMVGYFWRQRIYHFGVLDAPTKDVREASVKKALDLLKVVNDFSDFQRVQNQSCFMVFSGLVPDATWAKFYVDTFSSTVWPDLFIGLGHYESGDNTFADCRIMPPTLLTRPPQVTANNSSYKHDLELAVGSFEKLATTGAPPLWVVSVTMKGRWTVRAEGEKPRFLSRCLNDPDAESFGSVAQVCEDSDFEQAEIDSYLYSTLAHSINDSRVFSFDNEAALKEKLCRLKAGHTSTNFGIAAFDLEYEDFSNVCFFDNSHGAFSRLKMLRKLTDFFAVNFTGPRYEAACLNLAR